MTTSPAALLEPARNADGGFGARVDQPSEPEPTALAALALDDDGARGWLVERQRDDGSLAISVGPYVNDSATALAALALGPGPERERALDHVEASRARPVRSTSAIPIDPSAVGWSWANGTASWAEPTARALWALRVGRPASPAITDAVDLLRDRECVAGGWNYGNRVVLEEELPPFAQTTAIALIGLLDRDPELASRGLGVLRALCRIESEGGLSLATSVVAFRMHGATRDADRTADRLRHLVDATGLSGDVVALAWADLALSETVPGLER